MKGSQMLDSSAQNITSEGGDEFMDEYFSENEMQCHMDRLVWEQARLEGEVGRTCPPFYDRQEQSDYKTFVLITNLLSAPSKLSFSAVFIILLFLEEKIHSECLSMMLFEMYPSHLTIL